MTSIVIDTANFTPDQVKQILEFVDGIKRGKANKRATLADMPETEYQEVRRRAEQFIAGNFVDHNDQPPVDQSLPIAKCVGRDGNVEPEIAAKLFGAEPSVGNEPMKETHIFTDYKPE